MYRFQIDIPEEICKIDDELKAIYHNRDTICIWVFKTRDDRNKFMDETSGMEKSDREKHYVRMFQSSFKDKKQYNVFNCL